MKTGYKALLIRVESNNFKIKKLITKINNQIERRLLPSIITRKVTGEFLNSSDNK